ncbi:MAG: PQQ-dependent sugar dehydrogenase, partial [Chloroflexota bacterium]
MKPVGRTVDDRQRNHGGIGDPNARRILAYGLRNPFRMTFRPGTNELWLSDVGWWEWEEINRISNVTDGTPHNFGWPCYERAFRVAAYDNTNLNMCETLYAQGTGSSMITFRLTSMVLTPTRQASRNGSGERRARPQPQRPCWSAAPALVVDLAVDVADQLETDRGECPGMRLVRSRLRPRRR